MKPQDHCEDTSERPTLRNPQSQTAPDTWRGTRPMRAPASSTMMARTIDGAARSLGLGRRNSTHAHDLPSLYRIS